MNAVVVMLPAVLRPYAGGASQLEIEADTVGRLLECLAVGHPLLHARLVTPDGELRRYVNVFVGNASIRDGAGLATRLDGGSVVTILPAVAGG